MFLATHDSLVVVHMTWKDKMFFIIFEQKKKCGIYTKIQITHNP